MLFQKRLEVLVQRVVMSELFELLVLGVVLLNVFVMGIQYFNAPEDYLRALEAVMDACTYFYVAEALLKMFGLGLDNYFYSAWNCFDCFLVVVTTVRAPCHRHRASTLPPEALGTNRRQEWTPRTS